MMDQWRHDNLFLFFDRDNHQKTLIVVWDTSGVVRHGAVTVMARARVDVEVRKILNFKF